MTKIEFSDIPLGAEFTMHLDGKIILIKLDNNSYCIKGQKRIWGIRFMTECYIKN